MGSELFPRSCGRARRQGRWEGKCCSGFRFFPEADLAVGGNLQKHKKLVPPGAPHFTEGHSQEKGAFCFLFLGQPPQQRQGQPDPRKDCFYPANLSRIPRFKSEGFREISWGKKQSFRKPCGKRSGRCSTTSAAPGGSRRRMWAEGAGGGPRPTKT